MNSSNNQMEPSWAPFPFTYDMTGSQPSLNRLSKSDLFGTTLEYRVNQIGYVASHLFTIPLQDFLSACTLEPCDPLPI